MKARSPTPANGEHRSITLGDLAALVAGVAVVLVLPTQQSYWPYEVDFLGPWPKWLPWCFCLRQALRAACMVLVPVVLHRRACHGGMARPAEFLALCAAMPFLAESIETALIRLSYRLQTGISLPGRGTDGISTQFVTAWWNGPHWVFELILLLLGIWALVVCFLVRRRISGWLRTAFLTLAWLGAYEAVPQLALRWVVDAVASANGQPLGKIGGESILAFVGLLPRFILYTVPAIAAIRDVSRRHGRPHPTWLEWTSLGLVATLFVVAEPTELIRGYATTSPRFRSSWVIETLVRAVTMLAALVVGFLLSRAVGWRGRPTEGDHGPT